MQKDNSMKDYYSGVENEVNKVEKDKGTDADNAIDVEVLEVVEVEESEHAIKPGAETEEAGASTDEADDHSTSKIADREQAGKRIVTMKRKKTNRVTYYIGMVILFLAALLFFATKWVFAKFGNITLDSIVYQMIAPMDGTDMSYIWSFLYTALLPPVLIEMVVILLTNNMYKKNLVWKIGKDKKMHVRLLPLIPLRKLMILVSVAALLCSVTYTYVRCDVKTYITNKTTVSSIYEDYYVDPATASIKFSGQKKNLVYIYLESIEKTIESIKEGGAKSKNYIPNLTSYADKYTAFADEDGTQGRVLNGGGWTIAGMVSQSAAIPLLLNINGFDYNANQTFLPGAYSIGQILEAHGYTNELITGCDKKFAGTNLFFEQHGNYEIIDPAAAKEKGYIPQDYLQFWGYEDIKMYDILKAEITEKYNSGTPFNITAATLDSHADDMFVCDKCDKDNEQYTDQYDMVYHCTDSQIGEFISWFEQQPCYDDTVLVISGDHTSMATSWYDDCKDYDRSVYSLFVNSQVEPANGKVRSYTTQDMMPSTLAAMGVEIEGDRLGLGTNLFSDTPTLCEELGFEQLNQMVGRTSNYYNDHILQGTGSQLIDMVEAKDDGVEIADVDDMYDKYYVSTADATLKFPEQKKNLVYIYVESLEKTIEISNDGGVSSEEVIPNLEQLQKDYLYVEDGEKKQAYETIGSDRTIAAMVAQSSGVPLLDDINDYDYTEDYKFVPGIKTLGDVLLEQGYQNVFISGSDSKFAATDKFYTQHGNYEIIDYNEACNRGYITSNYYEHWGFEDKVLFDILKKQIKEKSQSGQPFNITCATMDTHEDDIYTDDYTGSITEPHMQAFASTDSQIQEFIDWFEEQPEFENTTVVITGDHLSHSDYFDQFDEYGRSVYSVFINSADDTGTKYSKKYSTLDMFPSTLSSMGVEIEGDRLGLGTNLFSDKITLCGKLGVTKLNELIQAKGSLYVNTIEK